MGLNSIITSAASNLTHLGLAYCTKMVDWGSLANGRCSKTMTTLILSKCTGITNHGVSLLKKMSALEELDLQRCGCEHITDVGGVAISAHSTLKILLLGYLFDLTNIMFIAVAKKCRNLEVLDIRNCGGDWSWCSCTLGSQVLADPEYNV